MKDLFKKFPDRDETIVNAIAKLKKELNAVILAHNYQLPEVQEIADYIGDSLGLSIEASKTKAEVIVFCGVKFMAETAKIISPSKKVLLPDKEAGCPMANMITADQLRELKRKHPQNKVLCYVNSSAEVKAESDICCTSSNAKIIAEKAFTENEEIIFVPDKHLGRYVASQAKRRLVLWPGYCPTHVKILSEHILDKKRKHPEAEVIVHPECSKEVIEIADKVLSTGGMGKHVKKSGAKAFIVGTENGMVYRLQKDNPNKKFYPVTDMALCPNMKRITLDKVLISLKELKYEVELPTIIIEKAKKSIEEMLQYV